MSGPDDVFVGELRYAAGDVSQTVETAAERGQLLSAPAALRDAGFGSHRLCSPDRTAYDLAVAMLEGADLDPGAVGGLLYATSLPCNGNVGSQARYRETRDVKHLMDFPASRLQADFGLDNALVLGVNQLACTSLIGAIRLAGMMLRSGEPGLTRLLCVTADRFPDGALYEQSYNLISDAAAGCVVTREPGEFRLLAAHAITNGAMSLSSDDETIGNYFTYTHRLIQETLARRELAVADIDWIVPQNINVVTWQVMSSLLGVPEERVLMPTMPEVGHMISGDNIVNLKVLLDRGQFSRGDKILMPMAGYGLNWQCILVEKT